MSHRLTAIRPPAANGAESDANRPCSGGGIWSPPPTFPSAGGGLVSTVDDYLAFARMLLDTGQTDHGRILARPTVEVMTQDHITARQKAEFPFFPGFWDTTGWGFGLGITTAREGIGPTPGSFGWGGGSAPRAGPIPPRTWLRWC